MITIATIPTIIQIKIIEETIDANEIIQVLKLHVNHHLNHQNPKLKSIKKIRKRLLNQ